MKLFIKSRVNGYPAVATDNVLRVPYGSNVQLICKGFKNVFWNFNSTEIPTLENFIKRNLTYTIDSNYNAMLRINNFGTEYRGFYTCTSSNIRRQLKRTVLIVSGKFSGYLTVFKLIHVIVHLVY